jgi:hypothetical protein
VSPAGGFAGGGVEKNPAGDYSINTHVDVLDSCVRFPSAFVLNEEQAKLPPRQVLDPLPGFPPSPGPPQRSPRSDSSGSVVGSGPVTGLGLTGTWVASGHALQT